MITWHPIETAPVGRPVLLLVPHLEIRPYRDDRPDGLPPVLVGIRSAVDSSWMTDYRMEGEDYVGPDETCVKTFDTYLFLKPTMWAEIELPSGAWV